MSLRGSRSWQARATFQFPEQVHDAVRNKQGISTEFLGRKQLKNVDHPVDVYLLSGEEIETPDLSELDKHDGVDFPVVGQLRWLPSPSLLPSQSL